MYFLVKHSLRHIVFFLVLLLAFGCTPKKNNISNTAPVKKIYISQGSPMELIKGAETEPLLILDDTDLDSYGEYVLKGHASFLEKAEKDNKEDLSDIEKENAAASGGPNPARELLNQYTFSFYKLDSNRIAFGGAMDLDKLDLDKFDDETIKSIKSSKIRSSSVELIFVKEPEGYRASSSITKENGKVTTDEKVKKGVNDLIHISISKDKSAISFLSREFDAKNGVKSLEWLYMIQKSPSTIKTGDIRFNYIEGPGVHTKWNTKKNKEIFICGKQSKFLKYPISKALGDWQAVLSTPLNFKISYIENYKPFTDLNQNCIFYVKNYRTKTSDKFINFASTFGKRNFFTGNIIATSILYYEEEYLTDVRASQELEPEIGNMYSIMINPEFEHTYKKTTSDKSDQEVFMSSLYSSYFLEIALHEFGHFLGLDHIFDGTPSIMSYQDSDYSLTDYDIGAVKELYD